MNDISPILLESVQGYFDMWFYADKEVKEIYKKVQQGSATFKEMKRFSERAGGILVESLKATFSADKLPDGKLYQNIAEKVITPMLEQNHGLINEVCGYVADDLNKAARIGTKAVTAAFNVDKAETVAQIAANCGGVVPGNKAAQLVENATMSMVDDFIQANLEFQKKLGLTPQIQRIYHQGKKRCEFCASLQYTGEYKGPGMPAEIFRRHRDCRCTLIYKPQKGPYQDPWSKAEKDDYQKLVADQRKYLTELDKMSAGERRLERNAKARARRRSQHSPSEWATGKEYRVITQEKILQEKALRETKRKTVNNAKANSPKKNKTYKIFNDGDEVNNFFYYDGDERGLLARKNSAHSKWQKNLTDDQRSAIVSYTADGYGDLNSWMRGYGNMDYYNGPLLSDMKKDIEKAISDYELKDNITVFRAIQPDAFKDYFDNIEQLVGTTYTDKAFMSTSPVKTSTAVNKDCIMEMSIPAGKGRGAYINQLAGDFQDKEYEFLLQHDSKFKITSTTETEDKLIIKMEMIV